MSIRITESTLSLFILSTSLTDLGEEGGSTVSGLKRGPSSNEKLSVSYFSIAIEGGLGGAGKASSIISEDYSI